MKARFASLLAFASALSLLACVTDEKDGVEAPDVLVRVVDTAGVAFGADTVYWSYKADAMAHHKAGVAGVLGKEAHGADTTTKAAARRNAAGTEWAVDHEGLHGAVYIRASYQKALAGSTCGEVGYKQLEINADTLPKEVTLTLAVSTVCP